MLLQAAALSDLNIANAAAIANWLHLSRKCQLPDGPCQCINAMDENPISVAELSGMAENRAVGPGGLRRHRGRKLAKATAQPHMLDSA